MNTGSIVTVITPYYNCEHELFEGAADSIAGQTIDRDRIEWIIVVHNSAAGELEFVKSITGSLSCASVYELNNDIHSASSPRNYALTKATGDYITFLDSDDMLTPECLETIAKGMDDTGADIGKYRGELREEDENIVSFLDSRVRFQQTKPLILLNKGDSDINKLLTMTNMMMSCQVIRRAFLEKYDIRFREDILIEEDVIFNLQSLVHAEKVAVFPQLIGYIYYMHHGSTMQEETVVSTQRLLKMCSDLSEQLKIGMSAGLYMRYLFVGHMELVADMIERSDASDDTRREIRDIFLPFFRQIRMPEPDEKILTQSTLDKVQERIENVVLFLDDPAAPDGVLRKIIRENKSTELGKEWDFESIYDHDDYTARVPVTDYDTYAPYIELTTRIGESGIFLSEDIEGYTVTSGSTGVPKKIPYTSSQFSSLQRLTDEIENSQGSTYLLMQSKSPDEKTDNKKLADPISGILLQSIGDNIRFSSYSLSNKRSSITSPRELVFSENIIISENSRLLYALLDAEVRMIYAPFLWRVFLALKKLEEDPGYIISDLKRLAADNEVDMTERIDDVERILKEGFDSPVIPKIWPNLTKIVAGSSGDFRIYGDNIKRYTGQIPIEGYYVSSEGIHGIHAGHGKGYRLLCDENYYEFLKDDDEAISSSDVVPGEKYRLIVTNRCGFYRYALGDVVEVLSVENGIPIIDVLYRKGDELKLPDGDAVVTPDIIYMTVKRLAEKSGNIIFDYCYALSEDEDNIELFLETEPDDTFADEADRMLEEYSLEYREARLNGKIKALRCFFLMPQTHEAYAEVVAYRQKTTPDQIKPVRYLDSPAKRRFFEKLIR